MIATVPSGTAFHTPEFAAACAELEAMHAMMDAAKAMAMTAIDVMWDPELRSDMAGAFDRSAHR